MRSTKPLIVGALIAAAMALAVSCTPAPEEVLVRETVIVEIEGETVVQEVEVLVTAAPLVPAKITTGWVHAGGSSAALVAADEKGWFEEGGVNIDIVRGFGSADVVTKVAAGTYEAGTGYAPELVRAIANNPDLDAIVAVFAYDGDPNALTGIKKEGLETPADLHGTTVSAVPGSTTQSLFPLYAEAVGIDPSTVTFTNVSRELVPIMVQQGDADLATGFISTSLSNFARLGYEADDLVMFRYLDDLPIYGNALILRKSWAEANPEAAKGLVDAYIRGLLWTRENPEEATEILVNVEPLLDYDIELNDWNVAAENYYFTDRVLENGIAYHTSENVATFIDLIVEGFGLERTPSVEEIYDPQWLPPAEELTVSP